MKYKPKHGEAEKDISLTNFFRGLNEEVPARFLEVDELSECQNLKFKTSAITDDTGNRSFDVVLEKRQGTTKISNTALPDSADVLAETYYEAMGIYILATASKLYYLDASSDPVEIGTSVLSGIPTFTEFKAKLFIHDGGTLKYIDSATPSDVTTVSNRYDDEIVGTGNGTSTTFAYTLLYPTIVTSSVTINYYDNNGTEYTITDDGSGALIGDVATGEVHTINYTTGAISFTTSSTPANNSVLIASYKNSSGAPKSKCGLIRASRLYLMNDHDNTSRLWYSGINDEYAWNSSSGGGYIDVDPDDGQTLQGAVNFFTTLILIKSGSMKRLDNFPGDAVFRVEPLIDNLGCNTYYRTINFSNGTLSISFLGNGGWESIAPSGEYGEVRSGTEFSKKFHTNVTTYKNEYAQSEFFPFDSQLWLGLYNSTTPLNYIYVLHVPYAQLTKYRFHFNWSSFKYVNDEMLIGGTDGNLYRMTNASASYKDNEYEYSEYAYATTAETSLKLPFNKKLMKQFKVEVYSSKELTGNIEFYYDGETTPSLSEDFPPTDYSFDYPMEEFKTVQVKFNNLESTTSIILRGVIIHAAALGK